MVAILTIVIVGYLDWSILSTVVSERKRTNWFRKRASNCKDAGYSCFGQEKKRELQIFQTLNQVYARLQEKTGFWSSLLSPLTI